MSRIEAAIREQYFCLRIKQGKYERIFTAIGCLYDKRICLWSSYSWNGC